MTARPDDSDGDRLAADPELALADSRVPLEYGRCSCDDEAAVCLCYEDPCRHGLLRGCVICGSEPLR